MKLNDIGKPGQMGFGVGVPNMLPQGFSAMPGSNDPESENYGNFQYQDGSVMVFVPRFDAAFDESGVHILRQDEATPAQAKRVRMPAFFNAGAWREGFFIDKYLCSKNGQTASSIKGGRVLSSYARAGHVDTAFSSLGADSGDNLGGAFYAAKTRGTRFFVSSLQMRAALGVLAMAQRQSGEECTCAWLTSEHKQPVGCVSNLGDRRMPGLAYETDGTYQNCGRTGSANMPAAVSHNGQANGVMDLVGIVWEVQSGVGERDGALAVPSDGDALEAFHLDQWSARTADVSLASGLASGWVDPCRINESGLADAVVDDDCGSGYFWRPERIRQGLCVVSGGDWSDGSNAGVWALNLGNVRGTSDDNVGFRAASFL